MEIREESFENKDLSTRFLKIVCTRLKYLCHRDPICFMEFVRLCRNEEHRLALQHANFLKVLALLQNDGTVNGVIQEIVLSSTAGNGIIMEFFVLRD